MYFFSLTKYIKQNYFSKQVIKRFYQSLRKIVLFLSFARVKIVCIAIKANLSIQFWFVAKISDSLKSFRSTKKQKWSKKTVLKPMPFNNYIYCSGTVTGSHINRTGERRHQSESHKITIKTQIIIKIIIMIKNERKSDI